MVRHIRTLVMCAFGVGLCSVTAQGADKAKGKDSPGEVRASSIQPGSPTIDMIMDMAVQNITRRYNLNDDQKNRTQELMYRGVHEFLREHEDEVFPVIRDLLAGQLGPPDNLEDTKRLGKAARPLAELAKESILKYNREWRTILTPEQKATHDFDLNEMDKTFAQIDANLRDWERGRATQGPFIPQPKDLEWRSPPTPSRPPPGLPEAHEEDIINLRLFEMQVKDFIAEYGLDEGQRDAARSICDEFKARAVDFRTTSSKKLSNTNKSLEAATIAGDQKLIRALEAERRRILAPYNALFGQMDERLHGLLRTTQIERHAKATGKAPVAKQPTKDARADQPRRQQVPKKGKATTKTTEPKATEPKTEKKGDK